MANIFLSSEIKQPNIENALFHVIPVPYEESVSYGGGTEHGAAAILSASNQLETYDQIGGEPYKFGIYTHSAVDCLGDAPVVLERIRAITRQVANKKQIPFVLGGEHTVSYGAVMGVADAYEGEKIGVVQIDAHADLRQEYEGSIWSHACVMKRLVDEGFPLVQLGTRAVSVEEQQVRAANTNLITFSDAREFCNPPRHSFTLPDNFPRKIYLTIDIDGLDSITMPATGTPVAGGLSFWQLIDVIIDLAKQREIVGMDLVEFAPIPNLHAYDFLAADLAHKMMGIVGRSHVQSI